MPSDLQASNFHRTTTRVILAVAVELEISGKGQECAGITTRPLPIFGSARRGGFETGREDVSEIGTSLGIAWSAKDTRQSRSGYAP